MDSKKFLGDFISKASLSPEELDKLKGELEGKPTIDIPDKFSELLDKFLTEETAKSKADVKLHFENRVAEEENKVMVSKLMEEGFSKEDIERIVSSKRDEKYAAILKAADIKLQKKYTATQSEKDSEYEAMLRIKNEEIEVLKNRYSSLMVTANSAGIEAENKMLLKNFLNSLPIKSGKNDIPREKALNILYQEVKEAFDTEDANIKFINGKPTLVRKSDETAIVLDVRNNIVDANRFVIDIANKLKLLETSQSAIQKDSFKSPVKTYSTTQEQTTSAGKYNPSSMIQKILKNNKS